MQPLDHAPELIERTRRVTAATLGELLASAPPPLLLDVRTEREWRVGRIDGAVNIPLSRACARAAQASERMATRRVLRDRLPLVDRQQPHVPTPAATRSLTWSAGSGHKGQNPVARPQSSASTLSAGAS
jgi:Rhodanese-like domain